VAAQLVGEIRAQHLEADIRLETTGDTEGEWDCIRMGQVLSNLISNAVQYGPKGSPINVEVKGDAQSLVVSVRNGGTPIPSTSLSAIFSSFARVKEADADERDQHTTNLGLGLFIAKEIVKAHGGTIDVTSTQAAGTTFTATFPKHAAELRKR
jgi:signal transduction histidine kinase